MMLELQDEQVVLKSKEYFDTESITSFYPDAKHFILQGEILMQNVFVVGLKIKLGLK